MFTWICPKCKAEVPPAYDECPRCNPPRKQAAAEAPRPVREAVETPPPVQPEAPRPVATPVAEPPSAVRTYDAPEPVRSAIPPPPVPPASAPTYVAPEPLAAPATAPAAFGKQPMAPWMASLLTVLAMAAILGGVYFWAAAKNTETTNAASSAQAGAGAPTVEPAKGGGSDFAKNLELAGFRITEDKTQKIQVRFLVINHSNAELPPLDGDVTLRVGRADTTIDFPFKLPSMAPMESREVTSVTKADVRAYELPDWQFIKPEFRVSEAKK